MKKWRTSIGTLTFIVALSLSLAGCSSQNMEVTAISCTAEIPGNTITNSIDTPIDSHEHTLSIENNIVEHDPVGYCGNTVTTVAYTPMGKEDGEAWEKSFWGEYSIALTDLLSFLDYNEEICRCIPEYTVEIEVGDIYGINLTEGYVRFDEAQVSLTAEQIEELQKIMDWAAVQESVD